MKTFGQIIIIFLFSAKLYGQNMLLPVAPSIEINAGYRLTQNGFYNQINSFSSFNSNHPLFTFGIGIGDHYALGLRHAFRIVLFNQILPQNIVLNDSINSSIRGFIVSAGAGLSLFFRHSKHFDLHIGIGVNAGRIKIYEKDYINKVIPIVAPKLILKPTFYFSRFYASLNLEYDYDFINSKWKNIGVNKYNDVTVNSFNYTSLTTSIDFGFFLHKR